MFTSRAERRLLLRQDNAKYRLLDIASRIGIVDEKTIKQRRTEINYLSDSLKQNITPDEIIDDNLRYEYSIMRHYEPYIKQEIIAVERSKKDESITIPRWLDYDKCVAIRFESREKLKNYLPENLSQASRIPGVNPSDIAILAIIIKRGHG